MEEFFKAQNAIQVSFEWNDEVFNKDRVELEVIAPTFQPGRSELSFAVYLRKKKDGKQEIVFVEPSISEGAHPDLIPDTKELYTYTGDGKPTNIKINSALVRMSAREVDSMYNPKDKTPPTFKMWLEVLDSDYDFADLRLEYRPDAVSMPDLVVTPADTVSGNLLRIED